MVAANVVALQDPVEDLAPEKAERTILIVDDEENVRNALRRALRKEGYKMHFAEGPDAALELLRQTPVDLVISDHMMPGMSGIDFLTIVRDRWPDVMRLMITGHADLETAIKAINHGEIYRFLTKPWDDVELKVTLYLAFERQDLERQNRQLLAQVRLQNDVLTALEQEHPGILSVARDEQGAIVLSPEELSRLTLAP